MNSSITLLVLSFLLTLFIIKVVKPVAYKIKLVDTPGGRKRHNGSIPLVGGIALYLGVCICCALFFISDFFIPLLLLVAGLIVLMGLVDDRFGLKATLRLAIQFAVATVIVCGLNLEITSLGNILGLGEVRLGWLSMPVAILALVTSINAFNMLDGMDGLVGSIALVSFGGLSILFGLSNNSAAQLLCLAFVGCLSAFLLFNVLGTPKRRRLKKVFMGDSGSMFIGLMLGALVIYGSQERYGLESAFSPITALWFILLPLLDMLSIVLRRVRNGKSPFMPDRTHLHHVLQRSGLGRLASLNILIEVHTVFIVFGMVFFLMKDNDLFSFISLIGVAALYSTWSYHCGKFIKWNKKRHDNYYQNYKNNY